MKPISTIVFLLYANNLLAQFGFGVSMKIIPCPNSTSAMVGIPSTEYFKLFGNSYTEKCKSFHSSKKTLYISHFHLNKNRVKVKSTASNKLFPRYRWFILSNDTLIECNRFGKKRKNNLYLRTESAIIGSDSIVHNWQYFIHKNDTTISNSYRFMYNENRKLIRWECTWNYFAYDDSTWQLAERSSAWGGVQRIKYEYFITGDIKLLLERMTSKINDFESRLLKYSHDISGNVIEIVETIYGKDKMFYYKYGYQNNVCVLFELYHQNELLESTVVF